MVSSGLVLYPEIVGDAVYSPNIAVLWATLVALIWYTCFTYESVETIRLERQESRRVAIRQLAVKARELEKNFEDIPHNEFQGRKQGTRLRPTWSDEQLEDLMSLSARVGYDVANWAHGVLRHLHWYETHVDFLDRAAEDPIDQFAWGQWQDMAEEVKKNLRHLREFADADYRISVAQDEFEAE